MALVEADHSKVAAYQYDAFGLSLAGSDATTLRPASTISRPATTILTKGSALATVELGRQNLQKLAGLGIRLKKRLPL